MQKLLLVRWVTAEEIGIMLLQTFDKRAVSDTDSDKKSMGPLCVYFQGHDDASRVKLTVIRLVFSRSSDLIKFETLQC